MLKSELYPERFREYWLMEMIQQVVYVKEQLKEKRIEYLNEIDQEKGVEWANQKLQEQLDYFILKLKETINEQEFNKYLKDNNLNGK